MGYPPLEELLPKSNFSVYKLVRMAAVRAIELADGKPRLMERPSAEKTPTVALEEIRAGKVVLKDVADQFKPEGFVEAPAKKENKNLYKPFFKTMALKNKKVVLGVTGSIAAYKAPDIVRRLQDRGAVVSVIMTKEAREFITPLTFESLTQTKVGLDMFARKEASSYIQHIKFAQEADILLIAPATANIIGKIAAGIADDLLTCTALAVKTPIMIAPAMNDAMFHNSIVQDNCKKLQQNGVKMIDPIKGRLACGTEGEGHLAEVESIVEAVEKAFL